MPGLFCCSSTGCFVLHFPVLGLLCGRELPGHPHGMEGGVLTLVAEEVLTGRRSGIAIIIFFAAEQSGYILEDIFHLELLGLG